MAHTTAPGRMECLGQEGSLGSDLAGQLGKGVPREPNSRCLRNVPEIILIDGDPCIS